MHKLAVTLVSMCMSMSMSKSMAPVFIQLVKSAQHYPARVWSQFSLAAMLTLGLAACASVVDRRAEQVILSELPRLVGPAQSYRVKAVGAAPSVGQMDKVRVEGRRIARANSPVIDYADVDLRGIRFDRAEKRVEAVGAIDASVKMLAADITDYLNARSGLSSVNTQFAGTDEVSVSAVISLPGLLFAQGPRVQVRGNLVPDGPRLNLKITSLSAAGFTLGASAGAAVQAVFNPIVNLSELPAPVKITSARVEGNALVVTVNSASADGVSLNCATTEIR